MKNQRLRLQSYQEVIIAALAAAEVCWLAPVLLALRGASEPPLPLLLWLETLLLLLGFFYLYRAVAAANLPLRARQGVLVLVLLLAIGLTLRYRVYAAPQWRGASWLGAFLRSLADADDTQPWGWVAAMGLVYLWARGIHLARRSLSLQSVGFSFRSGIVLLIVESFILHFLTDLDASGFVIPYFSFSLVAVALARIEEVGQVPNSSRAGFTGFWVGSTLAAVGLLVAVGSGLALFFHGGGLRHVVDWVWPVVWLLVLILVGIGVLFLAIVEYAMGLFSVDISMVGEGLQRALQRLGALLTTMRLEAPPGGEPGETQPLLTVTRLALTIGLPLAIVVLVLLFTSYRRRRGDRANWEESRESSFSPGALRRSLRAALEDGLGRLGDLAGLVDRFGVGSRFLAAISARRIYANMVRLATDAGYPRVQSQTPYEYLRTLCLALPKHQEEMAAITEAYVAAHYGQVPDARDDLQRLREYWRRIRAEGIKPPQSG
jgi:hypothetical protein